MKRKKVILLILFFAGIAAVVLALAQVMRNSGGDGASVSGFPVRLNEVMSANSAYYDENGNTYDWIELHNNSSRAISLSNYKLTDNERQVRYVFPSGTVLPADGYLVVWCKNNAESARYADFSISKTGGEVIVLMNSRSVIVDRLVTQPLERNSSLARGTDGAWQITTAATPGYENSDAGYEAYLLSRSSSASPVRISEIMSSNRSYSDERRRSGDWIELWNSSAEMADLTGMRLSDRADAEGYLFPEGTLLSGGEYLLVFCGGTADEGYAPFALSSTGGETVILSSGDITLDQAALPALETDTSYALDENGVWSVSKTPTPGFPNTSEGRRQYLESVAADYPDIRVTELMADNLSCLQDADGDFSDWIELTNFGADPVSLGGYFLSDRADKPLKWALPDIELPAGGRIVLFASGKDRSDADELHTSFALDRYQGIVTLCAADGQVFSSVDYPQLSGNESYALDETTGEWTSTFRATPGFSNDDDGYVSYQETLSTASALVLNEAMPGNATLLQQSRTTFYDWVEIKNRSTETIRLSGYSLTDNLDKPEYCALPDRTLEPGGTLVLLCTGDTPLTRCEYAQVALFLDAKEEQLYLIDAGGAVADVMTLVQIPYGASSGRLSGQNGQFYFSSPTPGGENKDGYRLITDQPAASVEPGVYTASSLSLSLSADGDIYYTTDGGTPTARSRLYIQPIELTRTSVIRAAAVSNGKMMSAPVTLNYFLNEGHTLPIVAVTTDEANLTDESIGILASVNLFNRNVERPANVSFFSDEGDFSTACGLKLHGAGSRATSIKKSYKIVFRQKYGLDTLEFPLFDGSGTTQFDSFLLRNGQDYSRTMVRDELLSKLAIAGTTELLVQDTRFCVLYINAEYQGIYCIKEAFSSGYFSRMFGVNPDSVELQRGYLTEGMEFMDLIYYAQSHDLSRDEFYRYIEERVNLESLIDWCIYEAYSANHDLAVNIRYYRSTEYDNNRWHYALLDMDFGFDGPATFDYILDSKHGTIFKRLLKNEAFCDMFLKRMAYQLENYLTDENVQASYETLTAQIAGEVPRERSLWNPNDVSGWERHLQTLEKYLAYDRIAQLKSGIAGAMGVPLSYVERYFGKANG